MKRILASIVFILITYLAGLSQLHIIVDQIPDNTPEGEEIYIAGNFQSWDPGNENYKLIKDQDNYSIDITPNPGTLEFKFTRGDWARVEGNENGGFLPNRTYNYIGGIDTLRLQILSWEDVGGGNSTAADNVQILDASYYMPELDRFRRIWVYLPPDYETSQKDYPVLYMHDGQNVFDDATSFIGEWHVDETLNTLFDQGDYGCIVVAIDNGGAERLNEYSPWINATFGGGLGGEYIEFIVNTLKPDIDSRFRTKADREYTGIMGSSMGGLISLYAGIEFQEVFSKIGSFSPAYWFSEESYEHARTTAHTDPVKIYTIVGGQEGNQFIASVLEMESTLELAGYTDEELLQIVHEDGQHSEWYWSREFAAAYLWLFGGGTSSIENISGHEIKIFPNPSSNYVNIEGLPIDNTYEYFISDLMGKKLINGILTKESLGLENQRSGLYFLSIVNNNSIIYTGKFIINK